ncbi:hypothetical protein H5410_045923 [Solanum commersonii]|uniref:Uncharacterized protein n=1 Tax=Solanum commersonii TaxID=4109 RepID=A0A9J5XAV6_SOLCO|nr:hypothetical protein H5410_045923 [Solanum commersonii]
MSKDVNNIPVNWMKLSEDIKAHNILFFLGTNNLFDFPCAFMAWTFEVIPHLRQQVTFVRSIKKTTLLTLIKTKEDRQLYSMHYLDRNDFKNMTSMKVW